MAGFTTYNYAVHIPMRINKAKALEVIKAFPGEPMFRSLYGNYHRIEAEQHRDCKVMDRGERDFDAMDFISTDEDSFHHGAVGRYIREKFSKPCRYEV